MIRIGQGYDVHKLVDDLPLVLGGVAIEYGKGLAGHSDADVLIHSLCDAFIGAAGKGDIGRYFPDTDSRYHNIDSRVLLREVVSMLEKDDWKIVNADLTIIAQAPKMAPHIPEMCRLLATDMKIDEKQLNIKATTTETLGFCGRGEGISALAVVLIYKITENI
ncbi:2-C-methyl-D-erythritol 2,4-cyclodiphosphate synthase [bacterium BMS3Bbin11]|nr:2-C-methyl-D-erythritol 2,4-cyclodiphosphate synthase [bacterium BMS3Abin11]GBE45631.1 2-C-methyl-D-erythritol 2,4-cyclodiphosphate synthase [bacterium BMS3Bbin11]GMT40061.1 MAG: 2-C-methyl-D-erythritol 2,4-cyclodiphosphate synthase [bacterium]HDH08062.1 2-C-methyl-D-erythritol 2,4-cyclodiphosphate synthase [Gammaproteobacteria bacterium]HDH14917.1 2-C-methyl-D-erythritol 2,4-cyclodiphosphate synthase [Gammaproteobacteria bacterium]